MRSMGQGYCSLRAIPVPLGLFRGLFNVVLEHIAQDYRVQRTRRQI